MWHHPEFSAVGSGGCWDGGISTGSGPPGVDLVGSSSGLIATDYNHHSTPLHPSSIYGNSFSPAPAVTPGGGGGYVAGYDGTMMAAGAAPPGYYGMYNLPSLAAASPWSASHTPPSFGYTAVRLSVRHPYSQSA